MGGCQQQYRHSTLTSTPPRPHTTTTLNQLPVPTGFVNPRSRLDAQGSVG